MTVNETMSFYADIILPKNFDKYDRKARVAEVLSAMGLKHKAKTMVGGTLPGGLMLRGLSGGERKRLSIAAGILAAPSIVFLDEPTSGLDSFAALTVMGHLKRMARDNGHVVIASIHQPRSAIWSMFDRVSDDCCAWTGFMYRIQYIDFDSHLAYGCLNGGGGRCVRERSMLLSCVD
jgi:ABC-type multidrug transport system ATPase subunit